MTPPTVSTFSINQTQTKHASSYRTASRIEYRTLYPDAVLNQDYDCIKSSEDIFLLLNFVP